ncbi:MAG: DUF1289 domain-containing protein [Bacteroidetes bacterium]|nr:DUF1289 domain-containing protein [Bacteroidota bacterium]
MSKNIKSPCIQVCKYDKNGICQGCYRSMEEITGWLFMTDEQKQKILENVARRKAQIETEQNNYDHYV